MKTLSKSDCDVEGPAIDGDCAFGRGPPMVTLGLEKKFAIIDRDFFWAS